MTTLAGSGSYAFADGTGAGASFHYASDVAVTPDGSTALVADLVNHRIRSIVLATGVVTTLAGSGSGAFADGTGAGASFSFPIGIAVTPDGSTALVTDAYNHRIRSIVLASGVVTTLAGSGSGAFADGTGAGASFSFPIGVAVTPDGSTALVADGLNNRIRSIVLATGFVTTLAGSGSRSYADGTGQGASFLTPYGVAVTPDGSTAIVTDQGNQRIRSIVLATGVVTTLAGSGSVAYADGTGAVASFLTPYGVAVTPDGSTALVTDRVSVRSLAFFTPP